MRLLSRRYCLRLGAMALASRGHAAEKVLYRNPLAAESDVRDFRLEGQAAIQFVNGRMRMQSDLGNFVFWCPEIFPDGVEISWEFRPIREPGLCILFFAAAGIGGKDLFDPSLPRRTGEYEQYHSGSIDALHVSYFRRRYPEERAFHLCNLRKSKGFHLVAQAADPLPDAADAPAPFRIALLKNGPLVKFSIDELALFEWRDDGRKYGPVLGGGCIGFRQMAPLTGEYANLVVRAV